MGWQGMATAPWRGITPWSVAATLAVGTSLACLAAGHPQSAPEAAAERLTFDAASVKPAVVPNGVTVSGGGMTAPKGSGIAIPRNTGGPGTDDPGRIHYPLISLKSLLQRAYDSYVEIVGPGWLDSDFVQVDATMPPDTSKAQFREMLRNLIADRFKLQSHAATREVSGYALTVTGNGPKMKESAASPAPQGGDESHPQPSPRSRQIGPDGFPIPTPRVGPFLMILGMPGDRARMVVQQKTMRELADALGPMLKCKVTDETGLTAKYDFTVTYSGGLEGPRLAPEAVAGGAEPAKDPSATEPLPDIFSALQSQLGLKLVAKKVPVEVLVVDHMEKTPAGN